MAARRPRSEWDGKNRRSPKKREGELSGRDLALTSRGLLEKLKDADGNPIAEAALKSILAEHLKHLRDSDGAFKERAPHALARARHDLFKLVQDDEHHADNIEVRRRLADMHGGSDEIKTVEVRILGPTPKKENDDARDEEPDDES